MKTTVLVVEDDLEINELLGEYLSLENIQYLQATAGQAGIYLASTQHPDALILDLMLPDIDGFEVARTLSARRATFDIPIIILSCMCQDCDREKGYASGALFYMNKPFLPDDLLSTLRQALDWKASLKTRTPAGSILLGSSEPFACCKAANQMTADLFARTDLSDTDVAQIREAVDTLGQWARQWNADHSRSRVTVDYRITPADKSTPANITWELTEDVPGILNDAFFKTEVASGGLNVAGVNVGGLLGWGSTAVAAKPLAPPARWLQVLAKTGAARFEKDTKSQRVRLTRIDGVTPSTNGSPSTFGSSVPVVEIDGQRFPTRLRDEALAAKRR
jgi:DNA-binding response OmpR family regulator